MQIILILNKDIAPHIADLILSGKLEGGYSIDYALNSLISYLNGREIVIYNFTKYECANDLFYEFGNGMGS